jgi:hypothetical protein
MEVANSKTNLIACTLRFVVVGHLDADYKNEKVKNEDKIIGFKALVDSCISG